MTPFCEPSQKKCVTHKNCVESGGMFVYYTNLFLKILNPGVCLNIIFIKKKIFNADINISILHGVKTQSAG